ncbi:MAG: hypothetical protein ACT4QF_03650 [Sporichthyaceae bacterium]
MNPRGVGLVLASLALVGGVVGTQVAAGGGDFVPTRAADPCLPRPVPQVSTGLDGLAEQLVLIGLNAAACRLDVNREDLVYILGAGGDPPEPILDAMRAGLLDAVDRLAREGRLPKVSEFSDEIVEDSTLPGLAKRGVRALPDGLIDNRLPMDRLLRRAIEELDLRALLAGVTEPNDVARVVRDAVTRAAVDLLISGLNPFD